MARQRELFDFVMYGPVLENYSGNLCVRWCTPDGIPLDSSEIVHPGATAAGKDVVAWYKRTECGQLREKIVVKPGQPLRAEFWLDGVLPKPADGARSNPLIITGGKRSTAVNFQLEFGMKNRTLGFMHMSSEEVTVCVHREGRVWKRSFVMILPVNAPSEPGDYLAYACASQKLSLRQSTLFPLLVVAC